MIVKTGISLGLALFLLGCGQGEQGGGSAAKGNAVVAPDSKKLAMTAYSSLRKIEAAVEVGVRAVDYGRSVGETWFDVKQFIESSEASSNPKLTAGITAAMNAYKDAGAIWNLQIVAGKNPAFYFDVNGRCLGSTNIMSFIGCEELDKVKQQIPQIDRYKVTSGKVTNPTNNPLYKNTFFSKYDLTDAMQDQWRGATEHLSEVKKKM